MNVTNQNSGKETNSLTITQNEDGSYTFDWDSQDPNWSWLNALTSKELEVIIQKAIQEHLNGN